MIIAVDAVPAGLFGIIGNSDNQGMSLLRLTTEHA